MKKITKQNYLTEKRLGVILKQIFPNYQFIHDKQVPNSNIKNRPDYRNDALKLIIEFDGHRHYSISKTILNDNLKDYTYKKNGIHSNKNPIFCSNIKTNNLQFI